MPLISSIITDAFRETNILPLGKVPTAAQSTEALRLFNAIITSIYGGDAGEELADWPLGTFGRESQADPLAYTNDQLIRPTINRRLLALNTTALTVYLSLYPQDGARMGIADPFGRLNAFPVTLDANGRTIEDAATKVLNVNGTFQEWFYRADLGQWVKISPLVEADNLPFPDEFEAMFVILLAMRLNPRYGRQMGDQSAAVLKQGRTSFVARYLQSQPLQIDDSISWPFMSAQSYDQQREFSSTSAFNRGSYFWGR